VSAWDTSAASYDRQWTHAPAGQFQRQAVWNVLETLVRPGDAVLDLGCGTGEDALYLNRRGARVTGIDASPEMVRIARTKGVDAHVMRIEEMAGLDCAFDVVLSNFGALNCIKDLRSLRDPLARVVRPRGMIAFCLLGRFCLWETIYFTMHGQFQKAARRWRGRAQAAIGIPVFYPSRGRLYEALSPDFQVGNEVGIGITVPPSCVRTWPAAVRGKCAEVDHWLGSSWIGAAIGDHRLTVFTRMQS